MKSIFRVVYLIVGFLLGVESLYAQINQVCPTVPDFTDLNQPWVTATYGTTVNPFQEVGLVDGRHSVISEQGTDLMTGRQLHLLPEGTDKVVRLGNSKISRQAESITYRFIVDSERPVLLVNFAVVLEDPEHPSEAQPRFVMQVLNREGQLVESCAEYDVSAGAGIEGFQTSIWGYSLVRWRDWTKVGVDLSAFGGEEVQVRFITYDCDYNAHFGYAYFHAACIPARLALSDCQEDHFELTAPDYFASYLWSNGQTSQNSSWQKSEVRETITCEITSAIGCRFSLYAKIEQNGVAIPVRDTLIYDTICEGDSYTAHSFSLPPQDKSGVYINTIMDVGNCDASREVKLTLALNVMQRYTHIEDWSCEGKDYVKYGFNIRKPQAGVVYDSVFIAEDGRCGNYYVLKLNVASSEAPERNIIGDVSPCSDRFSYYRISGFDRGDRYQWTYPEGTVVNGSLQSSEISLRFPQVKRLDTLRLSVQNGCKDYEVELPLSIFPSYNIFWEDSVCTGEEYRKQGFVIPAQQETGNTAAVSYYKTVDGCDSTIVLNLAVYGTPEVDIVIKDSVFCLAQELELNAVIDKKSTRKRVGIGDILCKDGSIVAPADYAASGKEAMGVVFWVDGTGIHGWAVDLWEKADKVVWGEIGPIPPPAIGEDTYNAICDLDGLKNTRNIIASAPANLPVATVSYAPGWYLPSMGQLNMLYHICSLINTSLTQVGGELLKTSIRTTAYWSSSIALYDTLDKAQIWILDVGMGNGFSVGWRQNSDAGIARGVRDF